MPRKKQLQLQSQIHEIRDKRVILDESLASLYQVDTKVLMQAVQRNSARFPSDFMFRLNPQEFSNLKSQIVTSSWGGRRKLPWAFTEQGVAMLSGVLHSPVAIKVNIAIMREFVKLRNIAGLRAYATEKLEALEKRVDTHDIHLERAFDAIAKMLALPDPPKKKIGFGRDEEAKALRNKR